MYMYKHYLDYMTSLDLERQEAHVKENKASHVVNVIRVVYW
jgi:hypothetical protein